MAPSILVVLALLLTGHPFTQTSSLAAQACELSGTFTDGNGFKYFLSQDGNQVTATVVQDTAVEASPGWATASGVVDPSPSWCPGGSATLQTPCHALFMQFFDEHGKVVSKVNGLVSPTCNRIMGWSNGAQDWVKPDPSVTTVHIVYMTHLDVGFTLPARNVCDLYFDEYFPTAFNVSNTLRQRGSEAQYKWTEFPWLILEYLNNTAQCAHRARTADEIQAMVSAVKQGDVQWHGNALNNFLELEDVNLFNFGAGMKQTLNNMFGLSHGTVTGKHTDVPGMSISAVPLWTQAGIRAYHIGYNGACKKPEALPPVFRWQHVETGTELLMMVENNYGSEIRVPGHDNVLLFMYQVDNSGPPTADAVEQFWNTAKARFPAANIVASTLDDYASSVLNNDTIIKSLTVVTEEIGDSWLYGSPADPIKLATCRQGQRMMADAVAKQMIAADDPGYVSYMSRLMKGPPEHNWGLSVGAFAPELRTNGNWTNSALPDIQGSAHGQALEQEWREQRQFCYPLDKTPFPKSPAWQKLEGQVRSALKPLANPSLPLPCQGCKDVKPGDPVTCGSAILEFSSHGSLAAAQSADGKNVWLPVGSSFAEFVYRTFDFNDFNVFNSQYNPNCGPPCGDFSKQGMDTANPESREWSVKVQAMQLQQPQADGDACSIQINLTLSNQTAHTYYGAPLDIVLVHNVSASGRTLKVNTSVSWANKQPTRLAEAMWLSFSPRVSATRPAPTYGLNVLGRNIDPMQVIANGTRHLHAVWETVTTTLPVDPDGNVSLSITSLDTPLVAVGDRKHLLFYDGDTLPDMTGGVHFSLHNNLWGTAFPQWYQDNGQARFETTLTA